MESSGQIRDMEGRFVVGLLKHIVCIKTFHQDTVWINKISMYIYAFCVLRHKINILTYIYKIIVIPG